MSFRFGYTPGYDAAFGVLGAIQSIIAFWSLIGIAFYVLYSLGLFTMAKRRGIHCYGLAWVPVANLWILGSISDQYKYATAGKVQKRRGILLGLCIAAVVLLVALVLYSVYGVVGIAVGYGSLSTEVQAMHLVGGVLIFWLLLIVIGVTQAVYQYIALYNLYHSAMPENATLFLVLSIFFAATIPFFVFACRNKDGGMPQRYAPGPAAQPAYIPAAPVEKNTAGYAAPKESAEQDREDN